MRFFVLGILCSLLLLASWGCRESPASNNNSPGLPGGSTWFGLPSAVTYVVQQLNEGTNWLLNKSQVDVAKKGDVRPATAAATFVADFTISVTNGKNSFETTATDVPCDKDGIPTEDSVTRLRVAVEDIKAKIKRIQN